MLADAYLSAGNIKAAFTAVQVLRTTETGLYDLHRAFMTTIGLSHKRKQLYLIFPALKKASTVVKIEILDLHGCETGLYNIHTTVEVV